MAFREKSEAAALRILELQRDRQRIAMQRAQGNIEKLEIRAPLAGMVVHETHLPRGTPTDAPRIGDQIYRGYPLVSIFDPSEMQVRCSVNEPDILALLSGGPASVYLDAYPGLALPAHFVLPAPWLSSGLGTPIKSFVAVFHIDKPDPHLLPDLSAAVVLALPPLRSARRREAPSERPWTADPVVGRPVLCCCWCSPAPASASIASARPRPGLHIRTRPCGRASSSCSFAAAAR